MGLWDALRSLILSQAPWLSAPRGSSWQPRLTSPRFASPAPAEMVSAPLWPLQSHLCTFEPEKMHAHWWGLAACLPEPGEELHSPLAGNRDDEVPRWWGAQGCWPDPPLPPRSPRSSDRKAESATPARCEPSGTPDFSPGACATELSSIHRGLRPFSEAGLKPSPVEHLPSAALDTHRGAQHHWLTPAWAEGPVLLLRWGSGGPCPWEQIGVRPLCPHAHRPLTSPSRSGPTHEAAGSPLLHLCR